MYYRALLAANSDECIRYQRNWKLWSPLAYVIRLSTYIWRTVSVMLFKLRWITKLDTGDPSEMKLSSCAYVTKFYESCRLVFYMRSHTTLVLRNAVSVTSATTRMATNIILCAFMLTDCRYNAKHGYVILFLDHISQSKLNIM